jgi:hypothetical protein
MNTLKFISKLFFTVSVAAVMVMPAVAFGVMVNLMRDISFFLLSRRFSCC